MTLLAIAVCEVFATNLTSVVSEFQVDRTIVYPVVASSPRPTKLSTTDLALHAI